MAKKTSNELTSEEKMIIKSVFEVIVDDSDLRRAFRNFCGVSVPELRKIVKKVHQSVLDNSTFATEHEQVIS